MQEKRVVVTGLGVISPIGNDIAGFWQALKEGRSGILRSGSIVKTGHGVVLRVLLKVHL